MSKPVCEDATFVSRGACGFERAQARALRRNMWPGKHGHTGGAMAFFVVRGSERAQASTLPKNMWPEDPARQGGAVACF